MTDEKYVLLTDTREKKNVARSASKRRTHNGKGGRVRLPSDHLTKKELKAMSGECESYKLNNPMTWKEFKKMPDDIKITYIKLLREKFGVSDRGLTEMFGCSVTPISLEMKRLGINAGKAIGKPNWDREGFLMWCKGVPLAQATLPEEETQEAVVEESVEVPEIPEEENKPCVPINGNVTFEGRTEDILKTVGMMLKGANVLLSIKWDVIADG